MKKISITTLTVATLGIAFGVSSAQAFNWSGGYNGKMGPFADRNMITKSLKVTKCSSKTKELQFWAEKSSRLDMPRITFEKVVLQYDDQTTETFSGTSMGSVRGFDIELNPNKSCPKYVYLTAKASGSNPGRLSNETYVSVDAN